MRDFIELSSTESNRSINIRIASIDAVEDVSSTESIVYTIGKSAFHVKESYKYINDILKEYFEGD